MLTLAIDITDAQFATIKVALEYTIVVLTIAIMALALRELLRKRP